MTNKKNNKGFTIIEILLVMVLIGLVASFLGRKIFSGFAKGQVNAAKLSIKRVEGDLDYFRLDCNFYPYSEQGLAALAAQPTSGRACPSYNPAGYMGGKKTVPKDPWGKEFLYTCEDGLNYEIKSLGADGLEGGEGDNKDISSKDE
ncbi:MAG: type II secretion system major pseudopilin GspG [Bdellovibrionota bacterium]